MSNEDVLKVLTGLAVQLRKDLTAATSIEEVHRIQVLSLSVTQAIIQIRKFLELPE